jgi:CubicO group peptidase (beta-lactamase class C family)
VTEVLRTRISFDSPPRVLPAQARKHRLPGAQQAINHAGETISAEFGELEFRTSRRVTRDSAFSVGSISKCFTATSKAE